MKHSAKLKTSAWMFSTYQKTSAEDEAVFSLWSVKVFPNNVVLKLIPNPKKKRSKTVSLPFSHPLKRWASLVIYCGGTDIFFGSPKLVPLKGRFWMTELSHNSPFGSASAPPTFPKKRGRDLNNRSPNLKSELGSVSFYTSCNFHRKSQHICVAILCTQAPWP